MDGWIDAVQESDMEVLLFFLSFFSFELLKACPTRPTGHLTAVFNFGIVSLQSETCTYLLKGRPHTKKHGLRNGVQ